MKSTCTYFLFLTLLIAGCAEKVASVQEESEQPPTEPPPTNNQPGENLLYFWFFDSNLPNNTELESINATFPDESDARIEFISSLDGYPNTNRRGSMERRNRPTDINYRPNGNNDVAFADANMRGIQVKQPFEGSNGENTMIFHLPSVGFKDLLFSFASKDEDAATALLFDYSVTATQTTWTTSGLSQSSINQSIVTDDYRLFELNLANIEDANDNPNLKVRLRFIVPDGDADNGDRVTFNNVALDGNPLD